MARLGEAIARIDWRSFFLACLVVFVVFSAGTILGTVLVSTPEGLRDVHVSGIGVNSDRGVELVDISISSEPGSGRVFASLSNSQVLSPEFQQSVVDAFKASQKLLPDKVSALDFTVRASSSYEELGGNSGGAVIALGMIANATESRLRNGVYVTASVDSVGFLHRVAYVPEKASFLKEFGASRLVVSSEEALNGLESDLFIFKAKTLKEAACAALEGKALQELGC